MNIYSDLLKEHRNFEVYLPDDYEEPSSVQNHYPTVYLLDGEWYQTLVWEIIKNLSANGVIPKVILVSIESGESRIRDLTPSHSLLDWRGEHCDDFRDSGGLSVFLEFLQSELIPTIEGQYRALPHRIIIGHSLAGLAVSYSLLTQPSLFQGLITLGLPPMAPHYFGLRCLTMGRVAQSLVSNNLPMESKIWS